MIGVWDPFWLESIVNNLLPNAVKFSGSEPIDVLLEDDGRCSRLVVKDHGIGIAPHDQSVDWQGARSKPTEAPSTYPAGRAPARPSASSCH